MKLKSGSALNAIPLAENFNVQFEGEFTTSALTLCRFPAGAPNSATTRAGMPRPIRATIGVGADFRLSHGANTAVSQILMRDSQSRCGSRADLSGSPTLRRVARQLAQIRIGANSIPAAAAETGRDMPLLVDIGEG